MDSASTADFLIVGGGIAGASVGYWLAPHGRVLLLEREDQPGYHATGRSAAMFMAHFGTPQVRALAIASRPFFEHSAAGFAEHALLTPRGAMMVARPEDGDALEARWQVLRSPVPVIDRLDAAQTCAWMPALRANRVFGALIDRQACDIDVHALLQGYLRGVRRHGGRVLCNAEVTSLRRRGDVWQVLAGARTYEAPRVINAAGAWADRLAQLAGARGVGLQPRRRSAFTFAPPTAVGVSTWPMTFDIHWSWYVKPDAGKLLGSPANLDLVEPQDVQPEELDIASAVHRIELATHLQIRRPLRTWAGLRSMVADGGLIGGFDPELPGFFWCAGQGGNGIQTSPAMGQACAALVRGLPLPTALTALGLTEAMLSPARLGRAGAT